MHSILTNNYCYCHFDGGSASLGTEVENHQKSRQITRTSALTWHRKYKLRIGHAGNVLPNSKNTEIWLSKPSFITQVAYYSQEESAQENKIGFTFGEKS